MTYTRIDVIPWRNAICPIPTKAGGGHKNKHHFFTQFRSPMTGADHSLCIRIPMYYSQTSLYRHLIKHQNSLQQQFEWNDFLAQDEADN